MFKDVFGKDIDLSSKKLWLFDMDGTIYKDQFLFDGTLELLEFIKQQGGQIVFITNNSSKSVQEYININKAIGIDSEFENYFTSSQATILYIKQNFPGAKVYCQGTTSLIKELLQEGIDVTQNVEKVDVVLLGFDTELTTVKLRNTCEILTEQDVAYIATNPDLACPVSFGFVPDCGSISIMIKNATGKYPKFIGKPEATMIDIVIDKFGYSKDDAVVIGDRLYTDIQSGVNAGVTTICVLTGEATVESIKERETKPTYTIQSVKEIYEMLLNS